MTRKNSSKNQVYDELMDIRELCEPDYDADVMSGVMGNMIDGRNQQMHVSLELTKLLIDKCASSEIKEQ